MNLKYTALGAIFLNSLGGSLTAAPLVDDFTGGLSSWTSTRILDANGGATNVSAFQVNASDELELNTTSYEGIEQYAFIRTGAALEIGEEAQVDMTVPVPGNRNFGIYVGGTAPVSDVREDYITVYGNDGSDTKVFTRGFDGNSEYVNLFADGPDTETLFLARTGTDTFEVGFYTPTERTIVATIVPVTENTADFVGIYADSRAAGIVGAISAFRIITLPYQISVDEDVFSSSLTLGDVIGNLSIGFGATAEPASFSLVAGDGDTHNSLFQISASNELLVNANFTAAGLDPASGTEYSIRVRGDLDANSDFEEVELTVTVLKNDDDDELDDDWELMWAGNLTDLDGTGTADFDNDGLWDIDEFELSSGSSTFFSGTFPTLDPTKDDTDGDMLLDGVELGEPLGTRALTSPILADSDFDGLSDSEEGPTALGSTGTDPNNADSDGDGVKDGMDTDPLDDSVYPGPSSSSVSVTRITNDASSGISNTKTYTHAVSGGGAATVGGVVFDVLDDTNSVPNFDWAADGDNRDSLVSNGGDWDTANGGVTGAGVTDLLTGFAFSGSATAPGEKQTYTLSGLNPGSSYDLRLYVRQWRDADSGRPIDLTFTNGTEVVTPFCSLLLDRPAYVLNDAGLNHDQAYFLGFSYVAQGTELVIDAPIPFGFGSNDSLHLYGLTNQDVNAVLIADIVITACSRNSSGQFVIDFTGPASSSFTVTKSETLQDGFANTAATVTAVTTDAGGVGQAVITAAEASQPAEFYRIEN